MTDTHISVAKPKKASIIKVLAYACAIIFLAVFGAAYAIPRVFSMENAAGPPAAIILSFIDIYIVILLASNLIKSINKFFDF